MSCTMLFALLLSVVSFQSIIGQETDITIPCIGNPTVTLSNLKYTLYNRQNQANGVPLIAATFNQVDPSKRVILIIHGWLQSASKAWVVVMKDTYLNQTDANIITLDWSVYSGINYIQAYCSVPQVGTFTGDLIYNLTSTPGISLNSVQVNGFSLGAHVAGYAGQRVLALTGSKIQRINGLDAAEEGYLGAKPSQRLDSSDANFVQAIHTSNYQFGYPLPYGHVDFQVNYAVAVGCGAQQNGCPAYPEIPVDDNTILPTLFCNHVRAIAYFLESINSDNFLGVPCKNCKNFSKRKCSGNSKTIMGENCPSSARGVLYLITNYRSPLANGVARTGDEDNYWDRF